MARGAVNGPGTFSGAGTSTGRMDDRRYERLEFSTMTTTHSHRPTADVDLCCPGADCELLAAPEADVLADVFKALADPTRVRLLRYLAESDAGTACACHLPGALGITQPTLSFHLRKLHRVGLVDREKRGRWVHWTVRPESLTGVKAFLDLPEPGAATCC